MSVEHWHIAPLKPFRTVKVLDEAVHLKLVVVRVYTGEHFYTARDVSLIERSVRGTVTII
jgi:hypothetical protein